MLKRSVLVIAAAATALGVHAADLALWEGASMSAWTNSLSKKWTNPRVTADGLAVEAVAQDPQLYAKPPVPFDGKCNQYVEITVRCTLPGSHQLFWCSEKGGGCTRERHADFTVRKPGEWETHKVRPGWLGEGRITTLRIDPPDPLRGTFEVKRVRVFEEGDCTPIDTGKTTGIVFEAQTPQQEYASVTWFSDASPGPKRLRFTTSPDGARHTYWFDFMNPHNNKQGQKSWAGRAYELEIQQVTSGWKLPVSGLRMVTGRPDLPPDVGVTYAGPEEAIPRAGRPLPLELILRNYGTAPAKNVRFALSGLPSGCRVLDASDLAPDGEIAACAGWDSVGNDYAWGSLPNERRFRIRLSDPGAGRCAFQLAISADGMAPRTVTVKADVLPSLGLAKADYVPAPKPVKTGKYEVGAFLFPGWDTHLWHGVWTRAPHRKPVLGWYDETNPEVIDWQIKHLVENGVSFVFVDWYWSRGHHSHGHWPIAFGKARYRGLLKWSLMWANHNGAGSHSVADQEKVTRYWIDNYFRDPQYMRIDGKPVVSIWSPSGMERDLGPGGCKKLLDVSRRLAREAGLPGIHFIAVRSPSGSTGREFLAQYKTFGFDGTCVYKYMDGGDPKAPPRVDGFQDYKYLADSSLRHWRELLANSNLPFLPSLTTAYDDRPWRGESFSAVKGINVADFRRICVDGKRFADESGVTRLLLGPIDEWGEGSIGYPNRELGFGMLEAVRDTFGEKPSEGWPLNYAPEDVGLGPYPKADDQLRRLRVLAIGNSYTQSLEPELQKVAKAAGVDLDLTIFAIGGKSLSNHWVNCEAALKDPSKKQYHARGRKTNLPEVLADGTWDVVTLQEQSAAGMYPESFNPWADRLVAFIRERQPKARLYFQLTWADPAFSPRLSDGRGGPGSLKMTQDEMASALETTYTEQAKRLGLGLIPVGPALQLYRKRLPVTVRPFAPDYVAALKDGDVPDIKGELAGWYVWGKGARWSKDYGVYKLRKDHHHLNREGKYLQACVWIAALTGINIVELPYEPDFGDDFHRRAPLIRRCAMDAAASTHSVGLVQ